MLQIHQICLQVRCGSQGHQLHHWDVTRMMTVTQESVKSAFCMHCVIFWSLPVSGKIFLYFCNILPFWRPFCMHSYFIFIFLLKAKCLQLESYFIANNLRKTMALGHFSISHNFFTYNWPPSWTSSWIYRNAQ